MLHKDWITLYSMLPTNIEGVIPNGEVCAMCDEVGRGSLSCQVTAACVIWPSDYVAQTPEDAKSLNMIKDSKKLSEKNRELLSRFIKDNAVEYAICDVDNEEIDRINILQATYKAMHGALDQLKTKFQRVVVDGDKFKIYMNPQGEFVPHTCVVGGDNRLLSIAAASIIAKVHRDNLVKTLGESDEALKVYGWAKNKGYGTAEHIAAIKQYGMSKYHRRSFIHFM